MSPHSNVSFFFPQKHRAEMRIAQSPQGPVWQTFSQRCLLQGSSRSHGRPQVTGVLRSAQRRTMICFPQGHGRSGAKALQGGHGPGWHCRTQTCGHLVAAASSPLAPGSAFSRGLEQGSPQEWGVRKRSLGGSRRRPQKQVYARSRAGVACTDWHPGQRQKAAAADSAEPSATEAGERAHLRMQGR
uniref:Uncharacterized protein n=1 Tax=Arundo donax TaxID=35708 RepID=A0A0A9DHY1_ARUDO